MGLLYLRARYYSPEEGRFLSRDPIRDGTSPRSLHAFSYAGGNPLNYTDPRAMYRWRWSSGTKIYNTGDTFHALVEDWHQGLDIVNKQLEYPIPGFPVGQPSPTCSIP